MSTAVADEQVEQAERLLDLWSSLALRHVALGSSCGCGAGGVSLRLEDFELDIVDYLQDSGSRCGLAAVESWCQARQAAPAQDQPVRRLLEDVQEERLPRVVAEWLLHRLGRTLRSFAELHGSAGGGA